MSGPIPGWVRECTSQAEIIKSRRRPIRHKWKVSCHTKLAFHRVCQISRFEREAPGLNPWLTYRKHNQDVQFPLYYGKNVIHSVLLQFIIHKLNRNRSENQKEKDNNIISDLQWLVLCRFFQSDFISLLLGTVHPKWFQLTFICPHVFQNSYDFLSSVENRLYKLFFFHTIKDFRMKLLEHRQFRCKEKSSMNTVQNFSFFI